jgi:hypothetical protein
VPSLPPTARDGAHFFDFSGPARECGGRDPATALVACTARRLPTSGCLALRCRVQAKERRASDIAIISTLDVASAYPLFVSRCSTS